MPLNRLITEDRVIMITIEAVIAHTCIQRGLEHQGEHLDSKSSRREGEHIKTAHTGKNIVSCN